MLTNHNKKIMTEKIADKMRNLKVINIEEKEVNLKTGNTSKKLIIHTKDENNDYNFIISDAWVLDKEDKPKIQGLWINEIKNEHGESCLPAHSAIAKVKSFYNIKESIKELIGSYVKAFPDSKNYLVLVACDGLQ